MNFKTNLSFVVAFIALNSCEVETERPKSKPEPESNNIIEYYKDSNYVEQGGGTFTGRKEKPHHNVYIEQGNNSAAK